MTKTRVINIRLSDEEQSTLSELSDRTGIAGGADLVRWALKQADALIAGTESAAEVWRKKGYQGRLPVIVQFGTDGDLFRPAEARPERPFTIGYFGRLVEEKGVATAAPFLLFKRIKQPNAAVRRKNK